MSDDELIHHFRAGPSPQRLLPLYQRYAELIYGWCLRYLGTPQRAEDAGAEVFTLLLTKLPDHEVTNFRSWLQSVVRNYCLMQLRREKRDPLELSGELGVHSELFGHPSGEVTETEDTRPLYRCLKTLNEEQRNCIRLFYLREGESYRSIAERLHLSVGRVRSHLQNGRRNLKICLEKAAATVNPAPE